jgi:hypothetical protein
LPDACSHAVPAILKHHLDAERTGCIWIPGRLAT